MTTDTALPVERAHELESHRSRLWALAYRLTGCSADADDIVHDAFERALTRPPADLARPLEPWLVRVTTNLSLDALRRRKRIRYAGEWLPTPVALDSGGGAGMNVPREVDARYEWMESLSFAFLLALEALDPRQRAVLVLRDVLGRSGREVAEFFKISEGNVKVILHRARRKLEAYDHARLPVSGELEDRTRDALERFMRALLERDVHAMEALVAEDVRTLTDGGNQHTALNRSLQGRAPVARLYLEVARRRAEGARIDWLSVNGMPAVLIEFSKTERRQAPCALIRCELDADGCIREIHTLLGRSKLGAALGTT